MTREEFGIIVKAMKAVYTDPRFIPDQDAFNVWYELIKDLGYAITSLATQKYMMTNGKVPTISDLRQMVAEQTTEELTEGEVRALLMKARRNGNWHGKEEFDLLPPILQRVIRSPENLKSYEGDDTQKWLDGYVFAYKNELRRSKTESMVAPALQAKINSLLGGSNERQAICQDV